MTVDNDDPTEALEEGIDNFNEIFPHFDVIAIDLVRVHDGWEVTVES